MRLTKARKAFLVVSKGQDLKKCTGKLFSGTGHLRQAYRTNEKYFKANYDVVEFDLVEKGIVRGEDFDTIFPRKK